jgi:hypothetical protein
MPNLSTEIEINASRQTVWQVLIRKDAWVYWNTFLYDCDPSLVFAEGQTVSLALRRTRGDEEMTFQPKITLMQSEAYLQWISSIPGFTCKQVFELREVGQDRTLYSHREVFSGALTRFFLPFIREDETKGIRRMAWELKDFIENRK